MEFIGDVRRRLFAHVDCEWNGVVRDITAKMERDELVNAELVCVHLAEFYKARAHWANFQESLEGCGCNGWDARDYKLWSDFGVLQSYGRINRTDHLVSLNEVEALLRKHAEQRFSEKHGIDLGPDHGGYRGDQTPDEDA